MEGHSTNYLWPPMVACREVMVGSLRIFPFGGQRQSVTKMIERYDQSSPSAVWRPRLWAIEGEALRGGTGLKAV